MQFDKRSSWAKVPFMFPRTLPLVCLILVTASGLRLDRGVPSANAEEAQAWTLDQLMVQARDTSPVMDIARAKLADYSALFDRAYYSWTPQLKVDALLAPLPERRRLRECVSLNPTDPLNNLSEVVPCPNQDLQTDERITADTEIGILVRSSTKITFPIYTFGKVKHGLDAARAGWEIGRSGVDYARGELDYLVKKAYYGAQLASTALRILKDGRKRLRKAKKDVETELKEETGRFTSNDLRKLLIDEAELEAGYLETEALSQQAWTAIRIAAGVEAGDEISLDSLKLEPVHIEPRSLAEYMELAVDARPDLQIARAAVDARRAQVKMAFADFLPNIALVGGFSYAKGTTADDPVDPFANDTYNYLGWGVVLGADWKLDYSVLISKHRRAKAKLAQQRAEYEALLQRVRLGVTEQVGTVQRRQKELEVRRIAMKAGKAWLISNTLNFGMGLTKIDELLSSLVAYSKARLTFYRIMYEYNLAVAKLSQSVGSELAVPRPE